MESDHVMSSAEIPFRKEMPFEYGAAAEVAPGVRRIIAENPSSFTHVGTNTGRNPEQTIPAPAAAAAAAATPSKSGQYQQQHR